MEIDPMFSISVFISFLFQCSRRFFFPRLRGKRCQQPLWASRSPRPALRWAAGRSARGTHGGWDPPVPGSSSGLPTLPQPAELQEAAEVTLHPLPEKEEEPPVLQVPSGWLVRSQGRWQLLNARAVKALHVPGMTFDSQLEQGVLFFLFDKLKDFKTFHFFFHF